MSDQRVRNVGERRLNGLLILDESALPPRFGKLHVGLQTARGEDRLRNLRHKAPGTVRPVEQARQLRALTAQKSAQADLRKIRGLRDADVRVGGDQVLLRGQ